MKSPHSRNNLRMHWPSLIGFAGVCILSTWALAQSPVAPIAPVPASRPVFRNLPVAPVTPAAAPVATPQADPNCAVNQPQLRKLFPIEMRMIKDFEGLWSDIPFKQNPSDKRARTYNINSNTTSIKMQVDSYDAEGRRTTTEQKPVTVCRSADGGMVMKIGTVEIPILVLGNKDFRFKINGSWFPFHRTQTTHVAWYPAIIETEIPAARVPPPEWNLKLVSPKDLPPLNEDSRQ